MCDDPRKGRLVAVSLKEVGTGRKKKKKKIRTNPRLWPLFHTFISMCVSLNTSVEGEMCSCCIRSLLRRSMACSIRLLISLALEYLFLELGCCTREPFVNDAKIWEF